MSGRQPPGSFSVAVRGAIPGAQLGKPVLRYPGICGQDGSDLSVVLPHAVRGINSPHQDNYPSPICRMAQWTGICSNEADANQFMSEHVLVCCRQTK